MMPAELVYAHAVGLAGELTAQQQKILEALCSASTSSLTARLRDGLTIDDCKDEFVTAASLMALAALANMPSDAPVEQITAGDFTIRKGATNRAAAASCLMDQAERMMVPYLKDSFTFMGV